MHNISKICLKKVNEISDRYFYLLFTIISSVLKKKNYEETVLACKRIIDKRNLEDCVEKELYFCMAEAYFNIKKYNEAKPNYEKCHQK